MILQSRKICLGPVSGKKKRQRTKCWLWPLGLHLMYFNLVVDCKIWCPFVVEILKRFICNLGCVHIHLLCPILPVYKFVLLMSPFTGDLWSRWWGWWAMFYYFCTCFRAVASPAKFSCTQRTRVNFQRLFMMVAVPLFLPRWFVWLQSESGVLVFWKYILFVFCF